MPLAFLFDPGGEPPRSFFYEGYALLALSLAVLPVGFLLLWRKMAAAAVPQPPVIPYFCAFGSLGGYLLIAALSPSVFTLLIIPFAPLSLLSLVGSLIYLSRCRPFTSYHRGAAIGCAILPLLLILLGAFR